MVNRFGSFGCKGRGLGCALMLGAGPLGCAGTGAGSDLARPAAQIAKAPEPLPAVPPGSVCAGAEITIDRGGLEPPIRFRFAPGDDRAHASEGYSVEARITDFNAETCWAAIRVHRTTDHRTRDFVVQAPVETMTRVDDDGRVRPSAPIVHVNAPIPRPTKGVDSPSLKDPFYASLDDDPPVSAPYGVVVTIHRPAPDAMREPGHPSAPVDATKRGDTPVAAR